MNERHWTRVDDRSNTKSNRREQWLLSDNILRIAIRAALQRHVWRPCNRAEFRYLDDNSDITCNFRLICRFYGMCLYLPLPFHLLAQSRSWLESLWRTSMTRWTTPSKYWDSRVVRLLWKKRERGRKKSSETWPRKVLGMGYIWKPEISVVTVAISRGRNIGKVHPQLPLRYPRHVRAHECAHSTHKRNKKGFLVATSADCYNGIFYVNQGLSIYHTLFFYCETTDLFNQQFQK